MSPSPDYKQQLVSLWPTNVVLLPQADDPTEEDLWNPALHDDSNCNCLICEYPDLVWEEIR